MPDLFIVFRVAFFSGFVSCGLAVLRGTRLDILYSVYIAGFLCGGIFYTVNSFGLPFTAGFAATAVVCIVVRIFHHVEKHGYLFIVIPAIYCITPGSSLYRLFLAIFNFDKAGLHTEFIYSMKVAVGCWMAILAVTEIMDRLLGKQADMQSVKNN